MPFDYYYKMAFGGLLKDGTEDPLDEVKDLIPSGSSWSEEILVVYQYIQRQVLRLMVKEMEF